MYCVAALSNNFGCIVDLLNNRVAAVLNGLLPDADRLDELFSGCSCVENIDSFIDVVNALESCDDVDKAVGEILKYTERHSYFCVHCIQNARKNFFTQYKQSFEKQGTIFGPDAFPLITCAWCQHVFRELSMSADVDDYN